MRGGWRYLLIALVALLTLAATTVVGYRVFAPDELLTLARVGYPARPLPRSGIAGELARAPLIVDGRLRVYAARRQVWADTPVGSRFETTPFWSLRRWPHEVVGVVAAPGPVVVSKWSDGALVAIDARTGTVAWRARSPVGQRGYLGGRTGADTVYAPHDLYTGRARDGAAVIVSTGGPTATAFDSARGTVLWSITSACPAPAFTGPGFIAWPESCADQPVLRRYDLATGAALPDWRPPEAVGGWEITALGCSTGRSECTAARTRLAGGTDRGWLLGPDLTAAPALSATDAWPVGELAVSPSPGDGPGGPPGGPPSGSPWAAELYASSLRDGSLQWTWRPPDGSADRGPARIVAVERNAIYLVTQRQTLVVLDPPTGRELARTPLHRFGVSGPSWLIGHVHARNRYVVVERLRDPPVPDAGEKGRYLAPRPVLVAGS